MAEENIGLRRGSCHDTPSFYFALGRVIGTKCKDTRLQPIISMLLYDDLTRETGQTSFLQPPFPALPTVPDLEQAPYTGFCSLCIDIAFGDIDLPPIQGMHTYTQMHPSRTSIRSSCSRRAPVTPLYPPAEPVTLQLSCKGIWRFSLLQTAEQISLVSITTALTMVHVRPNSDRLRLARPS